MGTDIYGTVEYYDGEGWKFGCFLTDKFEINRNYDMFGLLFGVRNYANFEPIAASRGVPQGITLETWAELDQEDIDPTHNYHSLTWITWQEIISIDPKMQSVERDKRVHEYVKTKNGLVLVSKFSAWSTSLTREQYQKLEKNNRIEIGDRVYAYEFEKAQGHIYFSNKLRHRLEELAAKYGAENVRLVVGFD